MKKEEEEEEEEEEEQEQEEEQEEEQNKNKNKQSRHSYTGILMNGQSRMDFEFDIRISWISMSEDRRWNSNISFILFCFYFFFFRCQNIFFIFRFPYSKKIFEYVGSSVFVT